jgi:hypothetical protein
MKRHLLSQFATLLQALTIVGLGAAIADPLQRSFVAHLTHIQAGVIRGGNAGAWEVLLDALPSIILRCAIGIALLWWLSVQKRLLADADFAFTKGSAFAAASMLLILLAVSAWQFFETGRPVQPDLVGDYEQQHPPGQER